MGMTTREIAATFEMMSVADLSPTLISEVTNVVTKQVIEWHDPVYPIVYLGCVVVKIRQDKQVINKAITWCWM